MATGVETKTADKADVEKNFTSLSFRSKRSGGPDNELIALGREFADRPENDGVLPTTSLRNLFKRALRLANGKAVQGDIDYFSRYMNTAGGQG